MISSCAIPLSYILPSGCLFTLYEAGSSPSRLHSDKVLFIELSRELPTSDLPVTSAVKFTSAKMKTKTCKSLHAQRGPQGREECSGESWNCANGKSIFPSFHERSPFSLRFQCRFCELGIFSHHSSVIAITRRGSKVLSLFCREKISFFSYHLSDISEKLKVELKSTHLRWLSEWSETFASSVKRKTLR